ncbi:5786_t:CDS:1, partial [Ambispora leptoticha]
EQGSTAQTLEKDIITVLQQNTNQTETNPKLHSQPENKLELFKGKTFERFTD